MSHSVLPAAVAGMFYPGHPDELKQMLETMLNNAKPQDEVPKAMIVPHAGYVYSGQAAADAYASLSAVKDKINRVVIFAPAHQFHLRGIATCVADYLETPLGEIPVDQEAQTLVSDLPQVDALNMAFKNEHAVEVHLPFLQSVLNDFKVVPFLVGHTDPVNVKAVVDALWGGDETLIVISSDLSHYHSYQEAQAMDDAAAESILHLEPESIADDQACGRIPIKGLLLAAKEKNLKPKLVALCNSGDTAGPKERVVGYGAFHFVE